jgi:hypothetical protein
LLILAINYVYNYYSLVSTCLQKVVRTLSIK